MEAAEVEFGPFRLDLPRRQLMRDGLPVRLGARSMDILCALAAAKGELVTKDQLVARVWPGTVVEENALQVHVSALRKALDDNQSGADYVITVPGRGYRFVCPPPGASPRAVFDVPNKPSIAVLPFSNLSGDREQEYFADGIAEDIITALARARWFFVIARNSSFPFKGKAVEVRQIAQALGVQYVLDGSVRKSDDRVRITVQLIDARAGTHVWGERLRV